MRKKYIIIGSLTVFMIILGIAFYFLSLPEDLDRGKQTSDLEARLGRKLKGEVQDRYGSMLDYKGKYFDLKYPEKASLDDRQEGGRAQLTDTYVEFLAFQLLEPRVFYLVQVFKSAEKLEDQSAVQLRKTQTDIYKEASSSAIEGGIVFTKETEGGEKSLFVKKGDIIYSFISSSSNLSEAENLFDKVASTINLKP